MKPLTSNKNRNAGVNKHVSTKADHRSGTRALERCIKKVNNMDFEYSSCLTSNPRRPHCERSQGNSTVIT